MFASLRAAHDTQRTTRPPHCTVMVKVFAASETPEKPKGAMSNAFTFVFAFEKPVPKIIPQRCVLLRGDVCCVLACVYVA